MSVHQKYRNRPVGGYSSTKEARRAADLKLMEKAGEIRNLREQVPFVLIPAQYGPNGEAWEKPCKYFADFVYEEREIVNGTITWRPVVEDTKGYRTADYVIKRKLMLMVHSIKIRET